MRYDHPSDFKVTQVKLGQVKVRLDIKTFNITSQKQMAGDNKKVRKLKINSKTSKLMKAYCAIFFLRVHKG